MQNYLLLPLTNEEITIIKSQLAGKITSIGMNEFGTFIGMKLMHFIKNEQDPFYQEIHFNFIILSQTEKGLNVIKSFISELKDGYAQSKIVDTIKSTPISYIEDPYSNYAFQNIIKQWPLVITQPLFPLVLGHILQLSIQQCSSNVVEAMLFHAPLEFRSKYIREITLIADISSMMVNRFGTFVLQKMISISNIDEKMQMLSAIKRSFYSVKSAKIKTKWNKICEKLSQSTS